MHENRKAVRARNVEDLGAMARETLLVIGAPAFRAPEAQRGGRIGIDEFDMAREGECLLDGIGDHDHVPAGAARRNGREAFGEQLWLDQEIADQDRARARPERNRRRQLGALDVA